MTKVFGSYEQREINMYEQAYRAGKHVALTGGSVFDNPWLTDEPLHHYWRDGWEDVAYGERRYAHV
jgi:hypothetical protein